MRISLTLLRIALGWLFFYAGITKILNPEWTAGGYLGSANTMPDLYQWFASPANIGWVNILNEWGLTLIGVSLILGVFVRWASVGGIAIMFLYYLPTLDFPYPNDHSYIVDEHIIYMFVFAVFYFVKPKQTYSLSNLLHK